MRSVAEEIVREKILLNTQDEIPHSVAITIDKYEETEDIDRIFATIYCEQKKSKRHSYRKRRLSTQKNRYRSPA